MQRDNKMIKREEETTPLGKLILQSKDHYSLFAKHLPREDRASLRQTCKRANALGAIYEFNLHHSPKLLLEQMRSLDKKNIGQLLSGNFAAESENYPLMQAKTLELPKDPYAIAFFALISPVAEINHEELKMAYDFLLQHGFDEQSCVMQSLAFQLEWHEIKLKDIGKDFLKVDSTQRHFKLMAAMLLHPLAYYNLRGADLSYISFDYRLELRYEKYLLKDLLGREFAMDGVPDFSWANLTNVNFTKAECYGVNFTGADFHRTELKKVFFKGSNLSFCNMDSVVLSGLGPGKKYGHWDDCDFTAATLSNINFGDNANGENLWVFGCTFTNASFENSILKNVVQFDLNKPAVQTGINFSGANLEFCDFKGSCLDGSNFKGANLSHAAFENAILTKALNLDQANLAYARYNSKTMFSSFLFFPGWNGMVNRDEKMEYNLPTISKQNCVMM